MGPRPLPSSQSPTPPATATLSSLPPLSAHSASSLPPLSAHSGSWLGGRLVLDGRRVEAGVGAEGEALVDPMVALVDG